MKKVKDLDKMEGWEFFFNFIYMIFLIFSVPPLILAWLLVLCRATLRVWPWYIELAVFILVPIYSLFVSEKMRSWGEVL